MYISTLIYTLTFHSTCHLVLAATLTTCALSHVYSLFEILQTLYFAIYGLVDIKHFELEMNHQFTQFVGKLMFGTYSAIMMVVLINMLIAMLSNCYQYISVSTKRFQLKYGRSRLSSLNKGSASKLDEWLATMRCMLDMASGGLQSRMKTPCRPPRQVGQGNATSNCQCVCSFTCAAAVH